MYILYLHKHFFRQPQDNKHVLGPAPQDDLVDVTAFEYFLSNKLLTPP